MLRAPAPFPAWSRPRIVLAGQMLRPRLDGRKKGTARRGRLNGGVGRGRSRCCRAVLALAGLSGAFAYIVPTQPKLSIPRNPARTGIDTKLSTSSG